MAVVPAPIDAATTIEQFFDVLGERRAEWANGKVVEMSPVNLRHHQISGLLYAALKVLLEDSGAQVFHESFVQRDPTSNTVRSPDVMVVLPEHIDRVKDTMLLGPADLIIEVVSPDSIGRDRGEKFVEYEALGVSEYWIIDPDRETIEFYQLRDRRYQLVAAEETYRSLILPQVTIEPGILWQKKLPTVRHLLRSWEGL